MALFKYVKVLVLAPAIGSALIGIAGLVFGVVLIVGHRHSGSSVPRPNAAVIATPPQPSSTHSEPARAQATKAAAQPQAAVQRPTLAETPRPRSAIAPRMPSETDLKFGEAIETGSFAFLKEYVGREVTDRDGERQLRTLVDMMAPYTPFHFGVDEPLPQVLDTMLLTIEEPVAIREGRYAMISGRLNPIQPATSQRGRGFLWVDTREGFALGGIFFYPSNGEPTPTLTIFSRQLDRKSVKMSELPQAFREDLSRWAATAKIPPVTTRYFIGASGDKSVLTHEEDYCVRSADVPEPSPQDVCEQMNDQAALVDMAANRFMEQTHNASNATMRMIATTGRVQ